MAYLEFIDDEILIEAVNKVFTKSKAAKDKIDEESFHKNVIDPFSAAFDMAVNEIDIFEWEEKERIRQAQKTMQNAIGDFHQELVGAIEGWTDLGKGGLIDVVNEDQKIIAEVKNKFSTVSGGKLIDHYKEFSELIHKKKNEYFGYTAYFVTLLPKNSNPLNEPFTPSDKTTDGSAPLDERIRIIDGKSFYEMITGRPDAFLELLEAIPAVISQKLSNSVQFEVADTDGLKGYFNRAFD